MSIYEHFPEKFLKNLSELDNKTLIDNLEVIRETLTETDKNDQIYDRLTWRINAIKGELQIREYFNNSSISITNELRVIEIRIEAYLNFINSKIGYYEKDHFYEKIISSFSESNNNESVLCAVKGSDVIIDINTLMSKDFHYNFIDTMINNIRPEYNHASELPHLFWEYILEKSNILSLFKEVGTAFLSFFNEEKIINNILAGGSYSSWDEVSSMKEYILNGTIEKKCIDFDLTICTHNQETSEDKWYHFRLTSKEITLGLRIGNKNGDKKDIAPSLTYNILLDYKQLLRNEIINVEDIKKTFIQGFSILLPTPNINTDIEKEIIHFVNFHFNLLEPKSEFTKF